MKLLEQNVSVPETQSLAGPNLPTNLQIPPLQNCSAKVHQSKVFYLFK